MERGSVIDAQVTLTEEIHKEIERCKDISYYINNYVKVTRNNQVIDVDFTNYEFNYWYGPHLRKHGK